MQAFERETHLILAGSACGAWGSNFLTLDAIFGLGRGDHLAKSKNQLAKCSAAASHLAQLVYACAREHLASKLCGMDRLAESLFQTGALILGLSPAREIVLS